MRLLGPISKQCSPTQKNAYRVLKKASEGFEGPEAMYCNLAQNMSGPYSFRPLPSWGLGGLGGLGGFRGFKGFMGFRGFRFRVQGLMALSNADQCQICIALRTHHFKLLTLERSCDKTCTSSTCEATTMES